jgi:hypothetical protein
VYVGFFGGALAVGAIGFYSAITLGMPVRARLAIVAIALASEAALFAVVTTTDWLRTARNYAEFANQGGRYDDVLAYLDSPEGKAARQR